MHHNLGALQRRALVVAQDLGLSAEVQAAVARAGRFSRLDSLFGAASFVELDEGDSGQQDLADIIGSSGSVDMSIVMKRIQALENEIVHEDTKAQSALDTELERLSLELQELNSQIAASEEERKEQTLAERGQYATHPFSTHADRERQSLTLWVPCVRVTTRFLSLDPPPPCALKLWCAEQHAAADLARLERSKSRTLERENTPRQALHSLCSLLRSCATRSL